MKTPTLIVRLVRLLLLVQSTHSLVQISRFKRLTAGCEHAAEASMGLMQVYV